MRSTARGGKNAAEVWLIDGYNVLCVQHERQDVVSFSHACDRLIDRLIEFAAMMNIRVILVFDAHKVKGGTRSAMEVAGLKVVYTKAQETAYQYIERTCALLKEQGEVVRARTTAWNSMSSWAWVAFA